MYCYHCGLEINEKAIEAKSSSLEKNKEVINEETQVSYICPRCGHLIHQGHSEQDLKSLAAASHAEIQRGRNSFAIGMGFAVIGAILLILAFIFFRLSYKPGMLNQLVINCPEFYVAMILFGVSGVMLIYGIIKVCLGLIKRRKYERVLKDLQLKTFVQ